MRGILRLSAFDKIKWPFQRGGSRGEVAVIGGLTVLILHIRYLALSIIAKQPIDQPRLHVVARQPSCLCLSKLKGNMAFTVITRRNCLISYRAGAWHYQIFPDFLKSPVSKWRIVGVKTRTKAVFFEDILINIPSENLSKLSKERMQYFCHVLKLNLRSRHSASASNCSMNRSLEPNMIINFVQQRILCLILPAYEKQRIIAGKNTDVIVHVPIVA